MSEWFDKVQKHPLFRKTAKQLSIPLAPELIRSRIPAGEAPLAGYEVAFDGSGYFAPAFGRFAGQANLTVTRTAERYDALVFDATGLKNADDAEAMYRFFQKCLPGLKANGRVVVISLPASKIKEPVAAAYQQGLSGFTKSLAKELGRKGATCNHLLVGADAEELNAALGLLEFLLGRRSAFITGQTFHAEAATGPFTASLAGKTVFITGAAGGIGEAASRIMKAYGAGLVLCDHPGSQAALTTLAAELDARFVTCDLRLRAVAAELAAFVTREVQTIDILIHNAGVTRDKTLAKMGLDQWQDVMQVNLQSVIDITEGFLSRRLLNEGGAVISVSSISGLAGNFGQTAYALSKAGLVGYMKTLACRLAPQRIRCNAVAPGFIETQMTKDLPLTVREFGRRLATLKQGGLPQDVGEALSFLASSQSLGLNAAVVRVCGGHFMGI